MDQSVHRYVITGCSSAGKSTLLEELGRRGYGTFSEPGRQIVQEQLASGGDGLPWEDASSFSELCIQKTLLAWSKSVGVCFFDRSLLDAVCALKDMGRMTDEHAKLLEVHRYASTVFFAPPWPELFEQDAERKHGFEDALEEVRRLRKFYPEHGYQLVDLPKTSVERRADFIVDKVTKILA